jgi:hypothetical protein
MTPTTLHRVMVHDFRDALDDLCGDLPATPEDFTVTTIDTLLSHLGRCETYLLMLRHNARKIERCAAVECSNASDAAAAVLAQPSLRERLGRAPLASDRMLP